MLHKILRAYERILAKNEKHETIEVTTATPLSEPEVAQLLRSEPFAKLISGTHRRVKRKVDPTIIGGAVARTSTSRTDASHKHMLMQIYQNMTNTL
jgi:F0F1-type ATP synthase delta subunit